MYEINIKIKCGGNQEDVQWFAYHACFMIDHMLSVDNNVTWNTPAVYEMEVKE